MQIPYSMGLDFVQPTKNPRYLNLSGFLLRICETGTESPGVEQSYSEVKGG